MPFVLAIYEMISNMDLASSAALFRGLGGREHPQIKPVKGKNASRIFPTVCAYPPDIRQLDKS